MRRTCRRLPRSRPGCRRLSLACPGAVVARPYHQGVDAGTSGLRGLVGAFVAEEPADVSALHGLVHEVTPADLTTSAAGTSWMVPLGAWILR